jgi:hypothetical protein
MDRSPNVTSAVLMSRQDFHDLRACCDRIEHLAMIDYSQTGLGNEIVTLAGLRPMLSMQKLVDSVQPVQILPFLNRKYQDENTCRIRAALSESWISIVAWKSDGKNSVIE